MFPNLTDGFQDFDTLVVCQEQGKIKGKPEQGLPVKAEYRGQRSTKNVET